MAEKSRGRKSFVPVAIAGVVAVLGLVALLVVDHGPWNKPVVKPPTAVLQGDTASAAREVGATVTPTDPKPALEPVAPGPKPVNPAIPAAPVREGEAPK